MRQSSRMEIIEVADEDYPTKPITSPLPERVLGEPAHALSRLVSR